MNKTNEIPKEIEMIFDGDEKWVKLSLLLDTIDGMKEAHKKEIAKRIEDDRFNIWKDISANGSITDEEYLEHYLPEYKKKWKILHKYLKFGKKSLK